MWPEHRQDLDQVEVGLIAVPSLSNQAEEAARRWVSARRVSKKSVASGEVFSAGGYEFAIFSCSPLAGGRLAPTTEVSITSVPIPVLDRVQLTYLDTTDSNVDLYQAFVKPFLVGLREERQKDGGQSLCVLAKDQVLALEGHEFGVRALDPEGRCGALTAATSVFVSEVESPALNKVHVLPYEDTLPAAYSYDLFKDFLQPFFQAHPFALYREGDHFVFRGARFQIMATDPVGVSARISNRTLVFCEGEALRPTILDLMPAELREDLLRLPRGLQALLLNTMANEEAVRGRLNEVHEVLRPGQGLSKADISSCGKIVRWDVAERSSETQKQCMVCLSDFASGESLRQLPCNHLFHCGCIEEWLRRSLACPICKQPARSGTNSSSGSASGPSASLLQDARVVLAGGLQGTVSGYDAAGGTFRVVVEATGQEQLVSADCLAQCLAGIRLVGLRSDELNGATVQIVGLDIEKGRYQVREGNARILGVRPDNCILPVGAIARVVGLSVEGARWNGTYGRIVSFDQRCARHIVAMQPQGQLLSVRPKNLRV